MLAGFSLLVFVPSPPAWRRPVEFGSTGHTVMVGNECVALLAHVLLAICDQTLLAVCVKARLITETRGFVDPAHPLLDGFLHISSKGNAPLFGRACRCSQVACGRVGLCGRRRLEHAGEGKGRVAAANATGRADPYRDGVAVFAVHRLPTRDADERFLLGWNEDKSFLSARHRTLLSRNDEDLARRGDIAWSRR